MVLLGLAISGAALAQYPRISSAVATESTGRMQAVVRATETVALLTEKDERHPLLLNAYGALARAEAAAGDDAAALDHFQRAIQLAGDSDNRQLLSWLDVACQSARNVGRPDPVDAYVDRQVAISRRRAQQYGGNPSPSTTFQSAWTMWATCGGSPAIFPAPKPRLPKAWKSAVGSSPSSARAPAD